ncbi:Protein of unknown function DUF2419 [Carpediemonas membranifera]|uniref:Queuosine 5'-phosphate N-glycosylase/hydrolase n=1 Tax=Carpediemonas membranifera TaxID=201153 RepID=A0A8J6E2A4_9EUKA|nr:Protein of unknown function DUF2419 [Carpediemonas membranifera]|eukprot:KAG9394448.1 Protein of unknown function DUF2419 [Carpediemonas membranifera]
MENPVLESAYWITERSKHVSIDKDSVKRLAAEIVSSKSQGLCNTAVWGSHELNPSTPDETTADWVFVVDILNFSFWYDDGTPVIVEYRGRVWSGYWSLVAAINKALDSGIPITTPSYYATITDETMAAVFASPSGRLCPLLKERAAALRDAGCWLMAEYDGTFRNVVQSCERDAVRLASLLGESLSSFSDRGVYEGRPVVFYKRAQICVADLWASHNGEDIGSFDNIGSITVFADYRVPQALALKGVLRYSETLLAKLNTAGEGGLLEPGCPMEAEIRGVCIAAADMVARTAGETAALVDFYLWDWVKTLPEEALTVPMHRTRGIYY